jgi:hypothetical protein
MDNQRSPIAIRIDSSIANTAVEPELNTTDAIFQKLISISDSLPTQSTAVDDAQRDAFEKASKAFYQAKIYFLKIVNTQDQYAWSDGRCTWVHIPHSSINECHNDDVLTYNLVRGRTTTSHSVIITRWANCSEDGRVMALSISSSVNGKTIRMPIGQYSTAQDYITNAQENLKIEIMNLLLAVYKERKPVQH